MGPRIARADQGCGASAWTFITTRLWKHRLGQAVVVGEAVGAYEAWIGAVIHGLGADRCAGTGHESNRGALGDLVVFGAHRNLAMLGR